MRISKRRLLGGALVAATLASAGCGIMGSMSGPWTATNKMEGRQEQPPNASAGIADQVAQLRDDLAPGRRLAEHEARDRDRDQHQRRDREQ